MCNFPATFLTWTSGLSPIVQGPIAPNLDKGLNRDMLVILVQFIHDPLVQELDWLRGNMLWYGSYHGDLVCSVNLLQTRLGSIESHLLLGLSLSKDPLFSFYFYFTCAKYI